MLKYYATDDRLGIVKEENSNFYRWDWKNSKWVMDNDCISYTYRTEVDEVTEEEAIYAIKHREVPLASQKENNLLSL